MKDVDTLARAAATDLRNAVARRPVPVFEHHPSPWRTRLVMAGVAATLVIALIVIAGRDATAPPPAAAIPELSVDQRDPSQMSSPLIASDRIESRRWELGLRHENALCLSVILGLEGSTAPSVCVGFTPPPGQPPVDPFQPMYMNDTRVPHMVAGRVPPGSTRVEVALKDAPPLRFPTYIAHDTGLYFVQPVGDERPTGVTAYGPDDRPVGDWDIN